MTYPIAETFHSIQGEGYWTGTPMYFVRLAGCNVGQYMNMANAYEDAAKDITKGDFKLFDTRKHSICTSFDGTKFLCDTDYHRAKDMTENAILKECGEYRHLCITGGEPYLHNLRPIFTAAHDQGVRVHIETSGTKPIYTKFGEWVTCCPKSGFLAGNVTLIDEFKFLVPLDGDETAIDEFISKIPIALRPDPGDIYLQPINSVHDVDDQATAHVQLILHRRPEWTLSCQLHKYLKVR